MIIRSRSLLNPRLIRVSASPNGKPPGPPARYKTGSGAGVDDSDGTIPTVRRIVRPFGRAGGRRFLWDVVRGGGRQVSGVGDGLGLRLKTGLGGDAAGLDGVEEGLVLAFVLVGVGGGEVGDGFVEDVAGKQVGGDGDPVAGAGVDAGQGCPAPSGVHRHRGGGHGVDVGRAFPVPQLAYVEVTGLPSNTGTRCKPRKCRWPPA